MRCPGYRLRAAAFAILIWTLSACSVLPGADRPDEYLDQNTGATVSVVGQPLVFARERPERAAHMRDYVTLEAAAVNRSGKIDYLFVAYFWTTFDAHAREGDPRNSGPGAAGNPLVVVADDRRIVLTSRGYSVHDAGIGLAVGAPPSGSAVSVVYQTDLQTLRFISAAHHIEVSTDENNPALTFELWDDRRAALGKLVRALSGE
jgi:hypothetical protein